MESPQNHAWHIISSLDCYYYSCYRYDHMGRVFFPFLFYSPQKILHKKATVEQVQSLLLGSVLGYIHWKASPSTTDEPTFVQKPGPLGAGVQSGQVGVQSGLRRRPQLPTLHPAKDGKCHGPSLQAAQQWTS